MAVNRIALRSERVVFREPRIIPELFLLGSLPTINISATSIYQMIVWISLKVRAGFAQAYKFPHAFDCYAGTAHLVYQPHITSAGYISFEEKFILGHRQNVEIN